jgi:hypothetical protein
MRCHLKFESDYHLLISGRYGYGKVIGHTQMSVLVSVLVIGHTQMSVFARYSKFKTIEIKNSPLKK